MRTFSRLETSTRNLILDTIGTHGLRWTAELYKQRGMCFTLFYWHAFGRAPRHTVLRMIEL